MLRLTREDVDDFAAASGDHNPLHCSPDYARATAFGQTIAHGVLGLLVAARSLPAQPGQRLRRIAVEFPRPLLLDHDYAVTVRADGPEGCWAIELLDGSKPVIRGVLEFTASRGGPDVARTQPNRRARAATLRSFARGQTVTGRLGSARADAQLDGKGIPADQRAALMLCSYVVGMELPGELALFTRMALEFDELPAHGGEPTWAAHVDGWQARTGSLRIGLDLLVGDVAWAKGSLRAFVRSDAAESSDALGLEPGPPTFAGKTALIVGASRGLGRALARSFAARGGRVIAVSRATLDREAINRALGSDTGAIIPIRADAGDPESLARALDELERVEGFELEGLDLLACNASPPLQPLTLEPATATRVRDHIHDAVALVSTPLALCLPRLARARGVALLSSSQAVSSPPLEWAHYVAGKRAGEGLFEVAALQYPMVRFVVARMPRLDTGFSLNVTGEATASVRDVALGLLDHVADSTEAGGVELIEDWARG